MPRSRGAKTGAVDRRRLLRRMPLLWRVFLANAALLTTGTSALALGRFTVSEVAEAEAVVLTVGLIAMLVANLLLLRPLFAPLERLSRRMDEVDVLRGSNRVPTASPGEVGGLERAFNEMLERLAAERREAGGRALVAQEDERRRIARSLHDEVGQTMTGVLFQLKRLAERVPQTQRPEVAEAQQAVRTCLDEVRRIARELRPETLDQLGLTSALIALSTSFSRRTGIDVERRLEYNLPSLDPETELVLYRVTQEGLTNVARHAGASKVLVAIENGKGRVILRVADDGHGMRATHSEGGGLRGIRERALVVGGTLAIKRAACGGVELRLEVPVTEPRTT